MTRRGKKRLLVLVSVAAVVGALATTGYFVREARRSQQLADAYRDGMAAYDAGDYESALRGLGKSLSLHRDDPEVLYRIADARQRVPLENDRHIAAAIPFARESTTRNPTDTRPLELLLGLYGRVGFITERLDAANRLLTLDPAHHDAQVAKIECLSALGRSGELRQAIADLIAAHPSDAFGHANQVDLMRLDGKSSSDILAYVASLAQQWPKDVALATLQLRTLAAFGNRDDAIEAAKRAVTLDLPTTKSLLDLVRTLDLLGLRSSADELLDQAVADERFRNDVFAYLIERAWKTGRIDRAEEQVKKHAGSMADAPSILLGWMALAMLPTNGDWQSTEPGRELASRADDDAQFWHVMLDSRALMAAQEYSQARSRLMEARSLRGSESLVWSSLGEVYQRLGETDAAVSSLTQAVSIDPTSSRAQMMLATSLLDLGRLDKARFSAERAVMSNPSVAAALTLARVYIAMIDAGQGDPNIEIRAVSILEEVSAQAPDQPDVQALLARTYVAVGHLQDAKAVIERMTKAERLPASAVLLDLIRACKQAAPELVDPLMALASQIADAGSGFLALQMGNGAEPVSPAKARAAFQSAVEHAADPIQRMQSEITLARFLDSIHDETALAELKRIAEAYTDQAEAQQALLDSAAAWTDQDVVSAAIARLKAITGEQGSRWRLADAQRKLAFAPDKSAASEVIVQLASLTQPPISNVKALMLTSDALLMLEDRAGAIRSLSRAIELQPQNPLLYVQTIDLLQSTGRSNEAEARLREFYALGGLNPSLQRRRIELLSRQLMWPEAISDCKALAAATGESIDQLRLAILYGGHGRTNDARQLFSKLLAGPTADTDTRVAAANFYAATDGFGAGLAVLQPLKSQLDPPEYTRTLASYYERHGRVDDAARLYKDQAESSGNPEDWARLVEIQVRNRQIEQARDSIRRGLAIAPENESLRALRGLVDALESGKLGSESIQGILTALVDESIRPAMTRLAEAMQYYETRPDDLSGYIRRLRTAVDRDPGLILGWQLLAGALVSNGQADEAIAAAQSAVRILPGSVRAAELLATTLSDAGHLEDARLAAQRWRELDPESPSRAELLLAQIERARGNPDLALAVIRQWIQPIQDEADTFPTRLGLYASILIQAGRVDEAHELIWPRAAKSADWAQAYIRLASEITQSPEIAIQWVDRAEPLVPLTLDTRAGLAQVRIGLGQQSARSDQFEKALALLEPTKSDPKTPGAVIGMLAGCYQRLGQGAKAEATYRSALRASPEDPIIMNNLAYLLLQTGGRAPEALDLAKQAIAGAQQRRFPPAIRANLMDTVGTAQLQLKLLAEAQDTFRKGLTLAPGSAMLHLGLAEALARDGRIDEARSEFSQVSSKGDANRRNLDLEARLEQVSRLLN